MPEQQFYGDEQECVPGGPQMADPPTIPPDQELPIPDVSGNYSQSTHSISDRPIALKRTSGVKK
jgi:hypothetical protein